SAHRGEGVALRDAVRSKTFLLFYTAGLCSSLGLFLPFAHLAPFAEDRGISHATAVTLFTLVGLGSTFGRFLLGGLADRMGRRRSSHGGRWLVGWHVAGLVAGAGVAARLLACLADRQLRRHLLRGFRGAGAGADRRLFRRAQCRWADRDFLHGRRARHARRLP